MKTYIKNARGQECLVYGLILELAEKYNKKFKILELPKPIEVNEAENKITLPYYEGRKYNNSWGGIYGGALMGLELSKEVPLMIYDLSKVKVDSILEDSRINKIKYLKFDFNEWKKIFVHEVQKFVNNGLLTNDQVAIANKIMNSPINSHFMFSNGDFYPRNFINIGRRIVLIDWQTWDESYRANLIDYWENIVAFCYIHMWSNHAWQLNYLKELQKHFKLTAGNFQKALLIKSFDQANFWFGSNGQRESCKAQIGIFKNALDKEYIDYLLKYTKPNIFYILLRGLKLVN